MKQSELFCIGKYNESSNEEGGVYKIFLMDGRGIKHLPILRLLGEDKDGILTIGCTGRKISTRIKEFASNRKKFSEGASEDKKSIHSEGKRLGITEKKCGKKLTEKYGDYKIMYSFEIVKDYYKEEEKRLLCEYYEKYGELPPLNHQSG